MSVFASSAGRGRGRGANTAKMARVRGALEHCSLYLGLAIYIALGAKVTYRDYRPTLHADTLNTR